MYVDIVISNVFKLNLKKKKNYFSSYQISHGTFWA